MVFPNVDNWGEIVNGPDTYATIVSELIDHQCCIIGWSDGKHTHFDVLFTLSPRGYGTLQFGIRGPGNLFISIMRRGCFAFQITRSEDLYPSYIGEKLGEGNNEATDALTELINGVLQKLGNILN